MNDTAKRWANSAADTLLVLVTTLTIGYVAVLASGGEIDWTLYSGVAIGYFVRGTRK